MTNLPDPFESTVQLSVVTQQDILQLVIPEILDPTHRERWEEFVSEQPELAKEIRNRLTMSIPDIEARKIAIDEVSFAYAALRIALNDSNPERKTITPAEPEPAA